jgi:single-stranded-DNA-specific exonuclease
MTTVSRSGPTLWSVNPYSWQAAENLARSLKIPLVAAMVLCGRGFTDPTQARMFLDCSLPLPDPFLFSGMEGAVLTLSEAVDAGRRIIVHGDYDADGITATALLVIGLRELGAAPEWYLPSRFQEGFGLSRRAVETIAGAGDGVLVTVDCGVNYPDEVALARKLGLDVIVVDHHQPGPVLPDCHLVHPVAGDYPHDDLCGVGLALKVMHGLHIHRCGAQAGALPLPLQNVLDLVAVGTIADLASLRGENRYYVREGLKLIQIGQRLGLRALATVSGCAGTVDSGTVAYRIAPRLNAAGRLADPSPPLRLLLTDDQAEADSLASYLHELNGTRQDVERHIFEEAVKRVESLSQLPPVVVLDGEGWHEGVVGIVASRLVERYNRPAILLGVRDGVAKGSGRSIPAYDLLSGLTACERHLVVYGGHTQAVGLTLASQHVDDFRSSLEEHAGRMLRDVDLVPVYRADAVLGGEDLNPDTASSLAALGPFGSDNPRPRILLVGASIREPEETRTGSHLRCAVEVDGVRVRGIGFGLGGHVALARSAPDDYLVGATLRVDEWKGTMRPELVLDRLAPACADSDPATTMVCEQSLASLTPSASAVPQEPLDEDHAHADDLSWVPKERDRRDRAGRLSHIAQVLATGESVLLLGASLPHAVTRLRQVLPPCLLGGEEICFLQQSGDRRSRHSGTPPRVSFVQWDTDPATFAPAGPLGPFSHAVALDPPFRRSHAGRLRALDAAGALVHLLYGRAERESSEALLRYLVHPRFAMVCLYKAGSPSGGSRAQEPEDAGRVSRAAELAWREAGVILSPAVWARAAAILAELGVERHNPGEARLDARSVPAYVAAEAEYEECLRLCRTL